MANTDEKTKPPPPGGFPSGAGAAGPDEGQQQPLERIADALEGLRSELAGIRQLLEHRKL